MEFVEIVLAIVVLYLIWEAREKRKQEAGVLQQICDEDIGKECTIKKAISGAKITGVLLDVAPDWVKVRTTKGKRRKVRLIRVSEIKELQFAA